MSSHEVAKDALQESLVQVISNIDKYQDMGRFKSWLGSVTVKKCLDILRKEKRHKYSDMDNVAEPYQHETSSLKLEHEDVMKFVNAIPEKYRIAINMFLVEGYSHKEIGEHMGISESSSRSLVSRGRKMIIESFQEQQVVEQYRTKEYKVTSHLPKLKII